MENEASIEIERPIEDVFRVATTCVVEWSKIVVEDEVIEEKPGMVGTTFRVVTCEGNNEMEFSGVVTEHKAPFLHACIMRGKFFDIEATYAFEKIGVGTKMTQKSIVNPKGFMKVIFFCFGWAMGKSGCKALEKELENLRVCCEEDQAPPKE